MNLHNAKSFLIFRNSLLKIGRPIQNSIYNIHDPMGIKFLTRSRLGLSHLNDHKFRHNLQDCLNPLCLCKSEIESTRYSLFIIRTILLDTIKKITNISVSNLSDEYLVSHLMYGNPSYSFQENKEITKASIKFIQSSERYVLLYHYFVLY